MMPVFAKVVTYFAKLTKVVTYFDDFPPIYLHDSSIRWAFKVKRQIKHIFISTCRRPIGTRLGKVLPYCDRLPPLKPHDLLIT